MMNLYDKRKNNDRLSGLAQALNARSNTNVAITPFQPVGTQNGGDGTSALGGAGDLLTGGIKLYEGIQNSGLFKDGSSLGGSSAISDSINGNIFGGGSSGSAITDAVNGYSSPNTISGAIDSNVMGSGFNGMPLIGTAIGGLNGLGKTGSWEGGVQGMFGVNPDDSDVMQGIKGTGSGALTGFSVGGPVGAVIGGLLGLGSSFIDDI